MTIKQVLLSSAEKLNKITKNQHLDAEILLSFVLNKSREYLISHPEKTLTKNQVMRYGLCVMRRVKGIPIAYIIGYKYFYGLKFKVNKHVLIPRPETELMVEETLKLINQKKKLTIIDIGTGSGCIIISLINELKKSKFPISSFQFFSSDISKPALNIAKQNAKYHKVNKKIKFINSNLLDFIKNHKSEIMNHKLIITANLPYLTPAQIKNSPSIQKEPKLALTAGQDGLKYYRKFFKQTTNYQLPTKILCEIDPSQNSAIKKLIKQELPGANFQIKKDLAGLDRLVIIKF